MPSQLSAGQQQRVALPCDGTSVTFAVRPEKLRIAQNLDDAMQQNRATGRVLQSVYGGSSITYKVNCNEQVVTVFEQNREAQPVGLGEQVTLSWSPQHSIVVEV